MAKRKEWFLAITNGVLGQLSNIGFTTEWNNIGTQVTNVPISPEGKYDKGVFTVLTAEEDGVLYIYLVKYYGDPKFEEVKRVFCITAKRNVLSYIEKTYPNVGTEYSLGEGQVLVEDTMVFRGVPTGETNGMQLEYLTEGLSSTIINIIYEQSSIKGGNHG